MTAHSKTKKNNNQSFNSSEPSFMAEGGAPQPAAENKSDDKAKDQEEPPKSEKSSDSKKPIKERVYYADWIRAMAIILVIFVHCLVNSFDASGLDPEDVPQIQHKKDGIIKSLVQMGIPMFFYISGIGGTFFNTEKKNYLIFIWEKILRLLIPFIIAIFVFLMPRLYLGQPYEDWARPTNPQTGEPLMENDFWKFIYKTLPEVHMKLSWLWYLPALFIDFIITYPLLRWSIRRSRGIPFDPLTDILIILLQIVTLALWAIPCYFFVGNDLGETYLMPAVLTLGGSFFLFYTLQLFINTEYGYRFAPWIKLVGPLSSIAMCLWKIQIEKQNLYHIFLMINFDAIFFAQGVIDMCYWRQMLKGRAEMADTIVAPLFCGFAVFTYACTSPMNYTNMGALFFYPLYADYPLQVLHVIGTWLWVYIVVWLMAEIANYPYNATIYKFVSGCSLYAYLSHYFFIVVLVVAFVRPYKMGFVPAFFLVFFGTIVLILATYIPIQLLLELCFPPPAEAPAAEEAAKPKEDPKEGDKAEDDKPKDIENDAADKEEKKAEKVE